MFMVPLGPPELDTIGLLRHWITQWDFIGTFEQYAPHKTPPRAGEAPRGKTHNSDLDEL